ncbi:Mandelate racemase [compost metagenome]
MARGATAVKPRVAGTAKDALVLEAVHDAVVGRAEIMVDANEKGTPSRALRLANLARDYGVLFVEEPLPAQQIGNYRSLAAAAPIALACGEHLQGVGEFLPFIVNHACSVIQPDLAMSGGLTQSLRIARLAEAFGIEVAPHFLPGLFAHLAAASPSVTWLEDFPLLESLFDGEHEFGDDGYLSITAKPGLGFTWAAGAREAFELPD